MLKNNKVIGAAIEAWEEELAVKLTSESVGNMIKLAEGDKGYQANKFLIDAGWEKKGAGRPTKEAKKKAIRQHIEEYDELNSSVDLKTH